MELLVNGGSLPGADNDLTFKELLSRFWVWAEDRAVADERETGLDIEGATGDWGAANRSFS